MRAEFGLEIKKIATDNEKLIFLTGDLGFKALEEIREVMGQRFVNTGVSEQNMITMAAALASEGLSPICYSIAPFAVFRPAEQIRLDVCLHNLNVKIVGNGGGYGYGIMGSTHHAIEDIAVLSSFQNMICYVPFCNEDVADVVAAMMQRTGPGYLRLGRGEKPAGLTVPDYAPVRQLLAGEAITVVSIGPVTLNVIKAIELLGLHPKKVVDLFVVSEMPVFELSDQITASVSKTKKLLIVEEHVARGGFGENLALLLLKAGISCQTTHLHADGYPNGLYGSQDYHLVLNGLDSLSISKRLMELYE